MDKSDSKKGRSDTPCDNAIKVQSEKEVVLEKIPDDWKSYSKMGAKVPNTCILVMKTPVKEELMSDPDFAFTCEDALKTAIEKRKKCEMVVDLSLSAGLYDDSNFKDISYLQCKKEFDRFPSREDLANIHKSLLDFEIRNRHTVSSIALVHCDLGLDRSAHFVCSYLVKKGYEFEKALEVFEEARGHQIKDREGCLQFLRELASECAKKNQSKPPDRWSSYSKIGEFVHGTRIIPVKVPLHEKYLEDLPKNQKFTVGELVQTMKSKGLKIGLVIDLTNTNKHYSVDELEDHGILHCKLMVVGHSVPPKKQINHFKAVIKQFELENQDNEDVILVHCTRGVNKTGFFICHYLIEELGWKNEIALEAFERARGFRIERKNYLDKIRRCIAGKIPEIQCSDDSYVVDDDGSKVSFDYDPSNDFYNQKYRPKRNVFRGRQKQCPTVFAFPYYRRVSPFVFWSRNQSEEGITEQQFSSTNAETKDSMFTDFVNNHEQESFCEDPLVQP